MTTDSGPAVNGGYDAITPEQWHAAAARAAARDRKLLEEAFSAIPLTDDIRRLFGAVIWELGRDHLLTLARLPALLTTPASGASTTTQLPALERGSVELPAVAAEATTAAVEAHHAALNHAITAWNEPGSKHPPDAVLETARRLLDIAAALAGRPVPVVSRSGTPPTIVLTQPGAGTHGRPCRAGQLRSRHILLGYDDPPGVAVLPQPETIETVIAGLTVTVQTRTGRVLILTEDATTYVVAEMQSTA